MKYILLVYKYIFRHIKHILQIAKYTLHELRQAEKKVPALLPGLSIQSLCNNFLIRIYHLKKFHYLIPVLLSHQSCLPHT